MKKTLFSLAVFCTLQANAQPYSISFSGTGLSTVKVQNLTSGVVVDVPAGDVLLLSTITGIPEVNNLKSSGLKVYPNPMTDKSTLEILPPLAGDAIISVCDMTGKVLTQYKGYVENYTQEFSLTGIKNGLHIVTVQGNGYQFSAKLQSNGKSYGTANIVKISNNIQAVTEKKSIMNSKGVQATVDMAYNNGERLKYTAVSGNNSTVMTDIPTEDKTVTFTFTECKDGDNNYYPVVQINTQLWMAENLKYLPSVVGPSTGSNVDPCYYINGYDGTDVNAAKATANYNIYGVLYNWQAAMKRAASSITNPSGVQGICPTGWHLPSYAEWTQLYDYLAAVGHSGTESTVLKAISGWSSGNEGTDNYGFTAIPGGCRSYFGGFGEFGGTGYWWSATYIDEILPYTAWLWAIYNNTNSGDGSGMSDTSSGFSVRCVRDF
jgi:uncharacterized protein (TIGR02145 family)